MTLQSASPTPQKIVFFGHHKCGSRFFRKIILSRFADANGLSVVEYDVKSSPFYFSTLHDLDLKNIDFESLPDVGNILVNLSNSGTPVVNKIKHHIPEFKGIHVVRDPRQILVSSYFHHLEGHPETNRKWYWDKLTSDRMVLKTLNLEDGILFELENITKDILENQIFSWEKDPRILELKLENIDENIDQVINDIQAFAELKIKPTIPLQNELKFANPASKSWKKIFTPKIAQTFKEKYGDDLIRMGYESDNDW